MKGCGKNGCNEVATSHWKHQDVDVNIYRCEDHPPGNVEFVLHEKLEIPNPIENFTPTRGRRPLP